MPSRKVWIAGVAAVAIGSPALRAQVPAVPGVPAAAAPAAGAATAGATSATGAAGTAATGAQSTGLIGSLGLGPAIHKCIAKLCATQFGQMLNNLAIGPMAGVSGGFIPALCPPPTPAQAAALAAAQPGSAAAAAAAVQASEAGAKARVAAVEYLGTVDCKRWPEAQKALINALLEDPNECVRFAAAKALNSGCCCDKKVIDALRVCVSGQATNAPAETSPRVKAAAFSALQNCLMKVPEDLPPERGPEQPERGGPAPAPLPGPERTTQYAPENPHIAASYTVDRRRPPTFEDQVQRKTFSQTVDEARRALFDLSRSPRPATALPTGKRSLFGALAKARQDQNAANLRRAREQGQVPPVPAQPPGDPAVEPSSYVPGSKPIPGTVDASPAAENAVEEPGGPVSHADPPPASTARRGLIGMLFAGRDR
jgi:hypothetical protein